MKQSAIGEVVPNPDISGLDSSSNKFQYAALQKFGTYYDEQIFMRFTLII
jgi:hypothetical protein